MLEARIYDNLYPAAVDQLTRMTKEGQGANGIRAVRKEVVSRGQDYMRAFFRSHDLVGGPVAADLNYYMGNLDSFSRSQFIQALTSVLAAVSLDHIEQTQRSPWSTLQFLSDINEAAYRGTPMPPITEAHLLHAAKGSLRLSHDLPIGIIANSKITDFLIRRRFGLADKDAYGQPESKIWTPADFFKDFRTMSEVKPVLALIHLYPDDFRVEFLTSGRKLAEIASGLDRHSSF